MKVVFDQDLDNLHPSIPIRTTRPAGTIRLRQWLFIHLLVGAMGAFPFVSEGNVPSVVTARKPQSKLWLLTRLIPSLRKTYHHRSQFDFENSQRANPRRCE